jgi:peptidoglycan/LPS O-acetylase OafA/YrhL
VVEEDAWTGVTNHFWSLCVEEQFYLLFPLGLLCSARRWRTGVVIAGIVTGVLSRLYLARQYPGSRFWALSPVAGEYLAWGCLIGLYEVRRADQKPPAVRLVLAGVALAAVAGVAEFRFRFLDGVVGATVYPTFHAIGFALIVLGVWRLEDGWLLRLLSIAPVVYLGKISYGLYVFHNFCYGLKRPIVEWLPILRPIPGAAFALAATIVLAMLSWHLFEHPINRLKDRFPYASRARREKDPLPSPASEPVAAG